MIKVNFISEILLSIFLLVLLFVIFNPAGLLMPTSVQTMTILALILVFLGFATFVWREKSKDEREAVHANIAGRFAYLVGAGVLVLAIVWQSFSHNIDPWLVYSLVAMVLAKIASRVFMQINN